MKLTSGISKRYKQSFILDEDTIRRIHALLDKSAKDLPFPAKVVFHVEREDNRYYETANIDEVLSDPNILGKRITILGIELRSDVQGQEATNLHSEDWNVTVAFKLHEIEGPFPEPDEARLRIATHDKNWALLLADELEPQIQRTFKTRQTPRWLLLLTAIPLLFLIIKSTRETFKSFEFFRPAGPLIIALILLLFVMLRFIDKPLWFFRMFGPEAAFLWGEEAQSYNDREQTRRNIQWGIIVAFLVSFVSSIAFSVFPLLSK